MRPGFVKSLCLFLLLFAGTILAAGRAVVSLHAQERMPRKMFEMSGQAVICKLEEKMIRGTISQKELKLLYDIFLYYTKEIVKEEISPRDEEVFFEAFTATERYYKTCPPEDRERDLKVLSDKCKPQ